MVSTDRSSRTQNLRLFLLLGTLITLLVVLSAVTQAAPLPQEDEPIPGDPLRGGRLYVSWDQVSGQDPDLPKNPLWPEVTVNQVPTEVTWRCVHCHGWDYSGSAGKTLSAANRAMGYPGMFRMTAAPVEVILPWLTGGENPDHDYSDLLSEQDLLDLASFLSTSLVSPELIANPGTFKVSGTAETGQDAFNTYCSNCHGVEGERINMRTVKSPMFIGDLAWSNPWEFAHTLRFGHISAMVPPARTVELSFSQQIDILAYGQTLPNATTIADSGYAQFDPSSQADTTPLAYAALAISGLIFLAVVVTLRRQRPR